MNSTDNKTYIEPEKHSFFDEIILDENNENYKCTIGDFIKITINDEKSLKILQDYKTKCPDIYILKILITQNNLNTLYYHDDDIITFENNIITIKKGTANFIILDNYPINNIKILLYSHVLELFGGFIDPLPIDINNNFTFEQKYFIEEKTIINKNIINRYIKN
jgi:hypothetical protein